MVKMHDVDIIVICKRLVSRDKEKVLTWGVFICFDKMDDIPFEKLVLKEKINVNNGTEGTSIF